MHTYTHTPITHHSISICNLFLELFAFQHQIAISTTDDATFVCDGSGCLHVVTGNHAHRDATVLTRPDAARHLQMYNHMTLLNAFTNFH